MTRRVARWLLWTPARAYTAAAAVVAVALVAVLGLNYLRMVRDYERELAEYHAAQEEPVAEERASWLGGPAPAQTAAPTVTLPPVPTETAAPAASGVERVEAFARTWLDAPAYPTQSAWHEAVRAHVAPDLHEFVIATPRVAVPKTTIASVEVIEEDHNSVEAVVTLVNGAALDVAAMSFGDTWQVTSYGPAH